MASSEQLNEQLISLVGRGKRKDVELSTHVMEKAWNKYDYILKQGLLTADIVGTMAKVTWNVEHAMQLLSDAKTTSIQRDCYIVANILRSLSISFTKEKRLAALKIFLELDEDPNNMVIGNLAFFMNCRGDVEWILKFTMDGMEPFHLAEDTIEDLVGSDFVDDEKIRSKNFGGGRPVKFDKIMCGNLMNSCIEHFTDEVEGRKMSWDLFRLMCDEHLKPDVEKLSILCKTVSNYEQYLSVRDLFSKHKIRMNALSYVSLMKSCIKNFSDESIGCHLAWEMLNEMLESDINLSVECLTVLSRAVSNADQIELIKELSKEHGVEMSPSTYSALIKASTVTDNCKEISWQLIYDMREKGLDPAPADFGVVAKMVTNTEEFEKIRELYAVSGLQMSQYTYSTFINSCIQYFPNKIEGKKLAWSLFDDLIGENLAPHLELLTALCKTITNADELEKMKGLFYAHRIEIGPISYSTMVNSCIENFSDKSQGKELAWCLFHEMTEKADLTPHLELLTTLCKLIANEEDLERMKDLFTLYGVEMNEVTYGTMMNSCIEHFSDKSAAFNSVMSLHSEMLTVAKLTPDMVIKNILQKAKAVYATNHHDAHGGQ